MIIYRGIGGVVLLFFVITLFLFNVSDLLKYTAEKFSQLNWWLPLFLTAIFCALTVYFANKHRKTPDDSTMTGRMMINYGTKHHLFFIPLPFWCFIFLALSIWQFMKSVM